MVRKNWAIFFLERSNRFSTLCIEFSLYNREIIKAERSCSCRSWRTVAYSPKRKPQRYFQRFVQQPEKCKVS